MQEESAFISDGGREEGLATAYSSSRLPALTLRAYPQKKWVLRTFFWTCMIISILLRHLVTHLTSGGLF